MNEWNGDQVYFWCPFMEDRSRWRVISVPSACVLCNGLLLALTLPWLNTCCVVAGLRRAHLFFVESRECEEVSIIVLMSARLWGIFLWCMIASLVVAINCRDETRNQWIIMGAHGSKENHFQRSVSERGHYIHTQAIDRERFGSFGKRGRGNYCDCWRTMWKLVSLLK